MAVKETPENFSTFITKRLRKREFETINATLRSGPLWSRGDARVAELVDAQD